MGPGLEIRPTAPLPRPIENLALRLAWPIALVNLIGTGFGFWYYRFQLESTAWQVWPWVPDSPLATLFMAASLALWQLDRNSELVNMLAFYGNIKLGLWTPLALVLFHQDFLAYQHPAMYAFLVGSHLLMVAQAFLIHRYSTFPPWAILGALAWYTVDLLIDYFIPIVGGPHHTVIPRVRDAEMFLNATAFDLIAAGAVCLTVWITAWAFLTRLRLDHFSV